MKAEIEKLAESCSLRMEESHATRTKIIRATIVAGIELALKQEASELMRAVGNILEAELTRKNSQSATEIFKAMRAVQLAEFKEEMK